MSSGVCPLCGAPVSASATACTKCKKPLTTAFVVSPTAVVGEPEFIPTALVSTPNRLPDPVPTALVSTPNRLPDPVPTALVSTPNRLPDPVPTALVSTPNRLPDPVPTALVSMPNRLPDPVPTALVASPNAELPPVPTALNMSPDVLAPLPARTSDPKRPRPSGPAHSLIASATPHSVPLPAYASPDAVRTLNEKKPLPEAPVDEPDGAPTGRVAVVFPPDASDTGRVSAPFPADTKPGAPARAPAGETREAPKVSDTQDEDAADTGRVVAPYRKAKSEADTGKVAVPFRAVEAPFALDDDEDEDDDAEPVSMPSVPMAISKKRKGATGTFDEEPAAAVAVVAPFPVGQEPPRRRRWLERLLIACAGLVVLAVGLSAIVVLGTTPKSTLRQASVRDASAQYKAKPGFVRVGTQCGGKPIPARLSVEGADKGETPIELGLPVDLAAGEHVLTLRLAARFGDPMEAQYHFQLPLPAGQPGEAIEVDLEGCTPQTMVK